MPSPPVTVVHAWTDTVAAWSTFAAAVVAFLGLAVSAWLAVRETRASRAQRQTELLREERVLELLEISEQYALYRAASRPRRLLLPRPGQTDDRIRAEERLKAVLALMPDGMVRMLKRQFGVTLHPADDQYLYDLFEGDIPTVMPVDKVLAELRSNMRNAGYGVQVAPKQQWVRHPIKAIRALLGKPPRLRAPDEQSDR